MYVDPINPIIKKTLQGFLQKGLNYAETAYDYDDVVYKVQGDPDNNRVLFMFKCNNAESIFQNGGNEMLEQEYAEFLLPRDQWDAEWDATLVISTAEFPQTAKVKKSMSEDEANAVKQSNENIRAERNAKIEVITDKIGKFKRDFIGAPIRKSLLAVQAGGQSHQCEIPYRRDEKYWITAPEAASASFYIALNFQNKQDQAMARIMLHEFGAAQKNVKNTISSTYHDKQYPPTLTEVYGHLGREAFPQSGILQLKLQQSHLQMAQSIEQPLTFIVGFRQFIAYHLHSMKQQLHQRMRERVNTFERVMVRARRDPPNTPNWKKQHFGVGEADRELEEEKKQESAFVYTKK